MMSTGGVKSSSLGRGWGGSSVNRRKEKVFVFLIDIHIQHICHQPGSDLHQYFGDGR